MGLREFARKLTGKKKNEKDVDIKQAKSLWNSLMKNPDQPAKLTQLYRIYQKNAGNAQARKVILQIAEETKSEAVYQFLQNSQQMQQTHPNSNDFQNAQSANNRRNLSENSRLEQENAAFVPKFFDESQFHTKTSHEPIKREDASDIDLNQHAAQAEQKTGAKNLVRNATFSEENGLQISDNETIHENAGPDILYVEELQVMSMSDQDPSISRELVSQKASNEKNSLLTGGEADMERTEKPAKEQIMNGNQNADALKIGEETGVQQNAVHFHDAPQNNTQQKQFSQTDMPKSSIPVNVSETNIGVDQNKILLFSLNGLVGENVFPELAPFLPDKSTLGRIGLYFYSYHSRENSLASTEPDQMGNSLAYGIPLLMSDQLYFTSKNQAVSMCPIRYSSGILSGSLDTDIQTLQTICQRQNLSCLLAGTITLQKGIYQIRTYIYQQKQQTLRILSKNVPYPAAPEIIIDLLDEVTQMIASKTGGIFESTFKQLVMPPLDRRQVLLSMQAKIQLFNQYLVYKNYCCKDILREDKEMLDLYVRLLTSEPENQIYILQLVSGMFLCALSGEKTYLRYRSVLYRTIDRNKEIPFVQSLIPYVNRLLKDA